MLSANVTPDVVARLRGLNVNRIMEKPFEMDELMHNLNQTLAEVESNSKVF